MKQFLLFAVMFFLVASSYSQQHWRLTQKINSVPDNMYGAVDAIDPNLVFVIIGSGQFLKSTNGGLSFSVYNTGTNEDFYDLEFNSAGIIGFAVGSNGTIIKTTDGGITWTILSSGTTSSLFSVEMLSATNIWVVGDNGVVLHSANAGNTWNVNTSLSSEILNSIRFRNANQGYILGNSGTLLYTSDGGVNWQSLSMGTTDDFFSLSLTQNKVHFLAGNVENQNNFYFLVGKKYYSSSDNTTWATHSLPIFVGAGATSLYFTNDTSGFYITAGPSLCNCSYLHIYKTPDSGQSWFLGFCMEAYSDNAHDGFSDMAFVDDNIGFATSSKHIFSTTNGGTGWNQPCVYSTSEFKMNLSFLVYPNPTNGKQLHFEFNTNPGTFSVEIVDITGKQVLSIEKGNKGPIDISGLETGIYFVNILKNGKTIGSEKLIKSN